MRPHRSILFSLCIAGLPAAFASYAASACSTSGPPLGNLGGNTVPTSGFSDFVPLDVAPAGGVVWVPREEADPNLWIAFPENRSSASMEVVHLRGKWGALRVPEDAAPGDTWDYEFGGGLRTVSASSAPLNATGPEDVPFSITGQWREEGRVGVACVPLPTTTTYSLSYLELAVPDDDRVLYDVWLRREADAAGPDDVPAWSMATHAAFSEPLSVSNTGPSQIFIVPVRKADGVELSPFRFDIGRINGRYTGPDLSGGCSSGSPTSMAFLLFLLFSFRKKARRS